MKFIAVKNYEEMSSLAAKLFIQQVKRKPSSVLGLATGSTPKGTYEVLIKDYVDNQTSYKDVSTVNLDEYVGLSGEHPNSYRYFMEQSLFNYINIRKENTNIPNGEAEDIVNECGRYDEIISELGVDIQLLGIGENGHIGFNEPGTPFQSKTHIVTLTDSTRSANARFFDSIEEVPTSAITMGINSIMQSKEIILLASGIKKANAMNQLASGQIDEQFPASALHLHDNVTIIADFDALRYCENIDRGLQYV